MPETNPAPAPSTVTDTLDRLEGVLAAGTALPWTLTAMADGDVFADGTVRCSGSTLQEVRHERLALAWFKDWSDTEEGAENARKTVAAVAALPALLAVARAVADEERLWNSGDRDGYPAYDAARKATHAALAAVAALEVGE